MKLRELSPEERKAMQEDMRRHEQVMLERERRMRESDLRSRQFQADLQAQSDAILRQNQNDQRQIQAQQERERQIRAQQTQTPSLAQQPPRVQQSPAQHHPQQQQAVYVHVNVYKLFNMPLLWHTGVIFEGKEYFFQSNNRVLVVDPGQGPGSFHRRIERQIAVDIPTASHRFRQVVSQWDGTRYDLFNHNCNFFVESVLRALGAGGLDREYLESSGMARIMAMLPGSSVLQERFVKTVNNAINYQELSNRGIAVAMWDDSRKRFLQPQMVRQLPGGNALEKGLGDSRNELGRIENNVGGAVNDGVDAVKKNLGGIKVPKF